MTIDLADVWRKIESHRKLGEQITKINQRITQLKNVAYAESSQIIDLATGMAEINLEDEMRKEFAGKKIRELRKKRSELIAKQRDIEVDLERAYNDLKRLYQRGLIKLDLFFKRFLKQLRDLRKTWNLMNEEGNGLSNVSRTLWELRGILGLQETVKSLPPYHKWKDEMRRSFTLLENFEESERSGRDK